MTATTALSIEERLRRIEDRDEILALHATYMNHVDKGWGDKVIELEKLREVFAEDIVWGSTPESFPEVVSAEGTVFTGVDAVIDMLDRSTAVFEFCMHTFTNPVLDIDGDQAVGGLNVSVGTRQDGVDNVWFLRAHTRYARTSVGWRISQIALEFAATLRPITPH